jgi:predicted acyltransferase
MSRYLSLDFLRGLTVALMIVVNNPGTWTHVFPPLRHAAWHGCTLTDLVFPTFLFVVGVSMFFSFSKHKGGLTPELTRKILRRTGLIFLTGLLLTAFPFFGKDYYTLRVMGVLQRIALAYGIAALLCVALSQARLIVTVFVILLGYWAALYALGGSDPYSLKDNFARMVDIAILTPEHVYKGFGISFDPEGLFSTLPASVTVILGYLAGGVIQERGSDKLGLIKDFLLYGGILAASGLVWGQMFPVNKPLWTSSYVFLTGGIALMVFALCIWLLDIKGWQRAARPFLVFGSNPLFAFVLAGVLYKSLALIKYVDFDGKEKNALYWVYRKVFYPIEQYQFGSMLYALAYCLVIWLFCWVLYRRKIFIKL